MLSEVLVKNVIERGGYNRFDRVGAPYGADTRDFPISENVHFAVMKLLSLGSKNPYRITNYFYFLTYYFVVLTALFVFRRFGMARVPALVAALLYAFLPYHSYRNISHLFLSSYYVIPLTVMVALWVYLGKMGRQNGSTPESGKIFGARWVVAVLICLLTSGAGVYYAFFGCFFLLAAGLACGLRGRRWTPLFQAGASSV